MILATEYFINAPDIDEIVGEFNMLYRKHSKIEDILAFATKYPNHRLILKFEDRINYKVLETLKAVHTNVSVRLSQEDMNQIPTLQKNGISYFLDITMPAYNYSTLDTLLKLKVSDVYIADDLWYDLRRVSKVCRRNNTRIRLIVNRIPCTSIDKGVNERSIFITPQTLKYYLRYVNVIEFDLGTSNSILDSLEKLRTMIKIWLKNNYWIGQLSTLNPEVKLPIPCPNYYPDVSYKSSCRRHCCAIPDSSCKKCKEWLDFANILIEKNIIFKKPDEEEEIEAEEGEEIIEEQ